MDLFYGTTFKEQIASLKRDIKDHAKRQHNLDYKRKKLNVAVGAEEFVGNNFFFIAPPLAKSEKPFKDSSYHHFLKLIDKYNITKYFFTYCFLLQKDLISKGDIKAFRPWIHKLIDIASPKLIVVLGEAAQPCMFNRKLILRDYHGMVTTDTIRGDRVLVTHEMDYFLGKHDFEDPSYRNYMEENDWGIIEKMYKEIINATI